MKAAYGSAVSFIKAAFKVVKWTLIAAATVVCGLFLLFIGFRIWGTFHPSPLPAISAPLTSPATAPITVMPQSTQPQSKAKPEQPGVPRGIWVDPYTRRDGIHVKSHWRKRTWPTHQQALPS